MSESSLQQLLLAQAPKLLPDLRLFRRNIMRVKIDGRVVQLGIKGQADLYGLARGGLHIELELKALTGRSGLAQRRWEAFCREWGVPYLLLRPEPDESPQTTVERWCLEIRTELALPWRARDRGHVRRLEKGGGRDCLGGAAVRSVFVHRIGQLNFIILKTT